MTDTPELLIETSGDGRIARLTLNRPERRNAFNTTLLSTLTGTLLRLDRDRDVRAIVLTVPGRSFARAWIWPNSPPGPARTSCSAAGFSTSSASGAAHL